MRRLTVREKTYFGVRAMAAAGFVTSATVLPHGLPAAVLGMSCGVVSVLTCIGVNAGGPGEQAGARAQNRAYARVLAPQGDWPPYAHREHDDHETPVGPR